MEQKYQIGNKYGSITWDIEKILADKNKFKTEKFSVRNLAHENPFFGNEKHIIETNILEPLIVVNLKGNLDKLIDGNHRLQKALYSDVQEISAYYLSFEEHRNYIVDYNEQVYFEVVNHWEKQI